MSITLKLFNYLKYLSQKIAFVLTGKSITGEMKANYKSYVAYSFLKSKYRKFLKNYQRKENQVHEYSKTIWWCWLQGEENAPLLCQKGLESIRNNFPEYEVVVITEKNFSDYVEFPDFILQKYKTGKITKTHFSDLLRLQLLISHGGIWIDSTCFITKRPDYAENIPLFVYQNKERGDDSIVASSWFISSEKNNSILTLTRDLLFDWWEKHNKLFHYFLVHFFFTMATDFYKDEWKNVPFYSNLPCHVLQRELFDDFNEKRFNQICSMSAVHKLTYKFKDKEIKNTFFDKITGN